MNRDFNTLLIPVESQVRELDGKLLLACVGAEKGFNCIIGSRAYIHFYASKVRNSIYLAKSMRRFSQRMFNILNDLGHRIVAWDEESLVRLPDDQYYKHRLDQKTFSHIDHLIAWGKSDAKVFQQYSGYQKQPIYLFGNPRIDILRPELRNYFSPEIEKIIVQHGNYILINTNFGQVNHFIPTLGNKEASRDKNFSDNSQDKFISNRYLHKQTLFKHFKTLIPKLAQYFPETNFIIRPHPSENLMHWQDHLNDIDNVTVVNNGNVIPWIMGSKGLISNGCTTSIEATILNTPTLGYYPITNEEIDDPIPKALCDIASNDKELVNMLENVLSDSYTTPQADRTILQEHISNLSGPFAVDNIISLLDTEYSYTNFNQTKFFDRTKAITHNNLRSLIKSLNSKKSQHRNSTQYHKYRFPTIDVNYLQERIERLQHITGRFSNINIRYVSKNIFQISS